MGIEMIRRFEPILYFNTGETFFPSDAKMYLEHCALWEAKRPFENKSLWQKRIDTRGIAAASDEVQQVGQPDDTYLGERQDTFLPFLEPGSQAELSLNPSGWTNQDGAFEAEVGPGTENRYVALRLLHRFYDVSSQTIPALRGSRFRYHAEEFEADTLFALARALDTPTLRLSKLLEDQFDEPHAVCYYLFYPGHLEPLQGCESVETGQHFGDFAGEWNCVTLLLDRPKGQADFQPRFIGLASRNANRDGAAIPKGGRTLDGDGRIGMVIHPWSEVSLAGGGPEHARIFVGRGTHSLYLKPGEKPLQPQQPGDPTRGSCGSAEPLAGTPPTSEGGAGEIYLAKVVGGMLLLGPVIGLVGGVVWSILEDKPVLNTPFGVSPPEPEESEADFPPEDGAFGTVIHPPDFIPADAPPIGRQAWPAEDPVERDGRRYTLVVNRSSPVEAERQVWLPGAAGHKGYTGRWGPRVSPDPFGRRSGMHFPAFIDMALKALGKHLSA